MGKVKADNVLVDQLTRLLNMRAEHLSESRLQQMRRGMVAHDILSAILVDRGFNGIAYRQCTCRYHAHVHKYARRVLLDVVNVDLAVAGIQRTCIGDLTAALCVERSTVENDDNGIALLSAFDALAVLNDREDLTLACIFRIPDEFGSSNIGQIDTVADPSVSARVLARLTGALFLQQHQLVEAVYVYLDTAFSQNLSGEVDRETEGIVELERVLAAQGRDLLLFNDVLQHGKTRVDGLREILFLDLDQLDDIILLLNQFRISGSVLFDNGIADLIQERLGPA